MSERRLHGVQERLGNETTPEERPLTPTRTREPFPPRDAEVSLLAVDAPRSDAEPPHSTDGEACENRENAIQPADDPPKSKPWQRPCSCPPTEGGWRATLADLATSSFLANCSTLLVLANVVLMCMPYHGMSAEYAARLEAWETTISALFIAEMCLKLLGLGCGGYWSDPWNVLDGSIASLAMLEMILVAFAVGSGVNLSFLRMLRMLRVLRMLRLMRKWKGLYKIVTTFIRALPQLGNLVFLILLTMFIFCLLGMQVAASRSPFPTFWSLPSPAGPCPLAIHSSAAYQMTPHPPLAPPYCAQLYGGVYSPETGYAWEPCHTYPGHACPDGLVEKPHYHFDYVGPGMITVFILLTGEWVDAMEPLAAIEGPGVSAFFVVVVVVGKYLLINLLVAIILTEFAEGDAARSDAIPSSDLQTARDMDSARSVSPMTSRSEEGLASSRGGNAPRPPAWMGIEEPVWPRDYSLCLFGPHNATRRAFQQLTAHKAFSQAILIVIIASSLCLALDTPRVDPHSVLAANLSIADAFFTAAFFMEMCIKIVAFGFATGPDAYLKSPWNCLDFFIVMVSLLVFLAQEVQTYLVLLPSPPIRPRPPRPGPSIRPSPAIACESGCPLLLAFTPPQPHFPRPSHRSPRRADSSAPAATHPACRACAPPASARGAQPRDAAHHHLALQDDARRRQRHRRGDDAAALLLHHRHAALLGHARLVQRPAHSPQGRMHRRVCVRGWRRRPACGGH